MLLVDGVGLSLAGLAEKAPDIDLEWLGVEDGASLGAAVSALPDAPDLLLLRLSTDDADRLGRLRELRVVPSLRRVPVLAVITEASTLLDLDEIRDLGVVGLIDHSAPLDHVAFRMNQVVRPDHERRSFERAPASFPVEVEASGTWTAARAVSLSVGGMGIKSDHPIEANTDVRLCFRLREFWQRRIKAAGRITYCGPAGPDGQHRLGLFFYPPGEITLALLEREVERLLDR